MKRFLLALYVLVAGLLPATAQVAFDAAAIGVAVGSGITGGSSFLTVGTGANRALVAYITLLASGAAPTGVTAVWDSGGTNQSMTLIDSFTNASDFGASPQLVLMFGLVAPTSGNKTLTISWTNSANYSIGAASFTGASQVGGTTTFANATHTQDVTGTSTTATSTITSTATSIATAQFLTQATADSVSDTQLWLNSNPAFSTSANYKTGAASVSLTADLTTSGGSKWMSQGVSIAPAAAATTAKRLLLLGVGQ